MDQKTFGTRYEAKKGKILEIGGMLVLADATKKYIKRVTPIVYNILLDLFSYALYVT